MNFKKTILGMLALVLVTIWVRNLFLFLPSTGTQQETVANKKVHQPAPPEKLTPETFAIDKDLRDPFVLPRKEVVNHSSQLKAERTPPPIESIQASLMGHVYGTSTPYVIAFDSITGSTNIYGLRDSLNGFILTKITSDKITWKSLKGRNIVWEIEQ